MGRSPMHVAVLASILGGDEATPAGEPRIPELKFEKYTLPNGLEVILHEDHLTPIVCVNVWYHVGSKDESRGRTGFAHLFEHMMFQGSEHHDAEYFGPLQEAGGRLNGSTNDDRTNYWEVVPSNYLELALWLESDRMGFLLPAMTQAKLDNQRDVVKNERRQSYENRPYGLASETIAAAMYPHDHPYSWPTIGYMEDLTAASRDDISRFFRRFYHPANASLCIAGDFDPDQARNLVAKYFGPISAGPPVEKLNPAVPVLLAERRFLMHDRVGLARLYLDWHTVPSYAADDAELDILATILAEGKSSRLYRALVQELQLAQDVWAYQRSGEIAGSFGIVATARPGVELSHLDAAISAEIGRLQSQPPTPQELEKAINLYEARFITGLESIGGFGGRADRLNRYNIMIGDPGYLVRDFDRYAAVDLAGLQRVARRYLSDKRVVLEILPGAERTVSPDPIAENAEAARRQPSRAFIQPATVAGQTSGPDFDRSILPRPGPIPQFHLPPIHRSRLSNGLELLVVEHHELPTVTFSLLVYSGNASNPAEKLGLGELVAAMLDEGTEKRSANQIADELAGMGAVLNVRANLDNSGIGLFTLKKHMARALDIYRDVLLHPTFPPEELERQRGLALSNLVRLRDQPTTLASLAMDAVLYGEGHPYGRSEYGSEASLSAITREDLVNFYRNHFQPSNCTLVIVGDVTLESITPTLESLLAEWNPGSVDAVRFPAIPAPAPRQITLVDKPGAVQSVIHVGQIGVKRSTNQYFPLLVMNTLFGGQFSSRLNLNLREEKGYTYGARSGFEWRAEPGLFVASASVQTAVTAAAILEFLREFKGITGDKPVSSAELEFAKASITRGFPAGFETPRNIAMQLLNLVEFRLPDDYFDKFVPAVSAVTAPAVMRAAQELIDIEHLSIVVIGDRLRIQGPLQETFPEHKLVISQFDDEFRLVPAH